MDSNNVGSMIELELGCTTNNGNPEDCSPAPLFKSVSPAVETMPVYSALAKLFDNYNPSPSQGEDHTPQEQQEEQELLEEMMRTDVMRTALQFLVDRGDTTCTNCPVMLVLCSRCLHWYGAGLERLSLQNLVQ